jgi:hypothetical protein
MLMSRRSRTPHRHNRFVAVALVNRIAGVIEALGDCGRVAHVYGRIINGHPRRYRDWGVPWMLDPQQSGGGALRNLGVMRSWHWPANRRCVWSMRHSTPYSARRWRIMPL